MVYKINYLLKKHYIKKQFLRKRQKIMLQTNSAINAAMKQSNKEQYIQTNKEYSMAWGN